MKSHPKTYLAAVLLSIISVTGACYGQDDHEHSLPPLEEMAAAVLAHPEDESLAYMFVSRSLSENPSAMEQLHADLLRKGLRNTPAETMANIGAITLQLRTRKYKEAVELLGKVCEHINTHRATTSLSRQVITDSLSGLLPTYREKEGDFTQLDLINTIAKTLDVDIRTDWRFFMNRTVLQITAEVELDQAREMLDTLQPILPPEEKARWVYNSAYLHILTEDLETAASELDTLEALCTDSQENYCDVLNEYLVNARQAIQRKRIAQAGLSHVAGEADMLVLSSLSDLDAGKTPSTTQDKAGQSIPTGPLEQATQDPGVEASNTRSHTGAARAISQGPRGTAGIPLWVIVPICFLLALIAAVSTARKSNLLAITSLVLLTACILGASFMHHNTCVSRRPALVQDIITLDCTSAQGKLPYHIAVENPTDRPIEVLAVKPSCGCTALVGAENASTIEPHSRLVLTLEADLSRVVGKKKSLNTLVLLKGYAPLIHQAVVREHLIQDTPFPVTHSREEPDLTTSSQRT